MHNQLKRKDLQYVVRIMIGGMQLKIHITQGCGKYVYHTRRTLKTKIFRPGSVLQEFILLQP
jgi:hypothetical protein